MSTKTPMALTAAALLTLSAAILMPATASAQASEGLIPVNYAVCSENPSALGCPGYYGPEQNNLAGHAYSYRRAAHEQRRTTRQNG